MEMLAAAIVEAICYISVAQGDDERANDDVRALESLVATLRCCSEAERVALQTAVQRARAEAEVTRIPNPDFLNTLRAIETDILVVE